MTPELSLLQEQIQQLDDTLKNFMNHSYDLLNKHGDTMRQLEMKIYRLEGQVIALEQRGQRY